MMKFTKIILASFVTLCAMSCAAHAFSDVNENDWFYRTVTSMTDSQYLNGYPDGTFRPNDEITGAEFVSIVSRTQNLTPSTAQCDHWASGAAVTAMNTGWYDYDELPPTGEKYDSKISRQLAVKITMNAFAPQILGDYNYVSSKMKDFSQLDGRYYDKVFAAYATGVVEGDDGGYFYPQSGLTRAEACAIISRALEKFGGSEYSPTVEATPAPVVTRSGGVSENGRLQVIGTQLCNESGDAIILNGMSSHGLQWFPQFADYDSIKAAADLGANVFRFAMYTEENGYISNPSVKDTLFSGVDNALALDMYAIVDWHILSDGNPMTHKDEAVAFFREAAQRYASSPGVIFEICNEPNGDISWSDDVKPYAQEVIGAIREINPNAVILVGSPTWSQDLHMAAADPLEFGNIMYTCHFYAGTHTQWLRDRIKSVMDMGLPVFVSEWGMSAADGSGGIYPEEAQRWIDFMNENNISRVNWSWCDKAETSAALVSGANTADGISDDELTQSGKFVVGQF
jgi:aryl-phospho-beta-D-glucosidase BglC (GH1 family)